MLRVSMLALGVSLSIGALAPHEAAAQLKGREPQGSGRGGVIVPQDRRDGRVDGRVDGRCYDERGNVRRDDDDRYDGHGKSRHDKAGRHDRNGRRDRNDGRNGRYDDDDCYDTNGRTKGHGPQFCRSGQGHPVYGMQWCRNKGWDNSSLNVVRWDDVVLRRPRNLARSDLGRSTLEQILGRSVYNRFDQRRVRLGAGSSLIGQWLDTSNGTVLNLYAGGLQIAQILDRNRDGRADVVRLR